jgi:hypothetical protein
MQTIYKYHVNVHDLQMRWPMMALFTVEELMEIDFHVIKGVV